MSTTISNGFPPLRPSSGRSLWRNGPALPELAGVAPVMAALIPGAAQRDQSRPLPAGSAADTL
ncbi:hypothetical protein [Nocardia aurantiaca]|uniref:Uncharacterized protein n=1 Tax=Nocardia aurantiaca TaxID=2675850 RepID=A0A6I3KTU4_9NOCA|nr:hypothetical protein [Nocardia aurantiaca]MTE14233.1 hypothetical protein [Nocardia aurantiaca]